MNIRTKLYLTAGVSAFFAVLFFFMVSVVSHTIVEVEGVHKVLMDMSDTIADINIVTYEYLTYREERMKQQWHSKYETLAALIDMAAQIELPESARDDYVTLRNLFSALIENQEARQELMRRGAPQKEIDTADRLEEQLAGQLLVRSQSLLTAISLRVDETQVEVKKTGAGAIKLMLALQIIPVLVVPAWMIFTLRSILKPLDELTKGAALVGRGGFDHRIRVRYKDEFDQVAAAFNHMVEGLGENTALLHQAETKAKNAKAYLQLQIDRMPIGLMVWDTDFRVQSWNPAAERIFGFTAQEASGKHPYDLIVPKEAQPDVDDLWRRLLKGDETAHSINENTTKDGRAILCRWTNTPLKEADGPVTGVLSMVQDITEQARAEAERSRLFDLPTTLIMIIKSDSTIVRVSAGWEELLGYPPAEMVGRSFLEFIHPDDLPGSQDEIDNLAYGKLTQYFENRYSHKDGTYRTLAWSASADHTTGLQYGVAQDITERNRMTEELRNSEENLKVIYETVGDVLFQLDVEPEDCFRFRSVNQSFLEATGLTEKQVMGKRIEEVIPETAHALVRGKYKEAIREKKTVGWEETSEYPSGVKTAEVTVTPAFGEDGACSYLIGSVHDITVRKAAEEGLDQQLHWMKALTEISRSIARRSDIESIFQVIMRHLGESFTYDLGLIGLRDQGAGIIRIAALMAKDSSLVSRLGLEIGIAVPSDATKLLDGMHLEQVHVRRLSDIDTASLSEESSILLQRCIQSGLDSWIAMPFTTNGKRVGSLHLFFKEIVTVDEYQMSFLNGLAENITLAVQNRTLYKDLEKSYNRLHKAQNTMMEQERLKAMGQMASGIAHDINNTLSPITLYTEALLESEPDLSERAKRFLKTIQVATKDIESTIGRLRAFYRKSEKGGAAQQQIDIAWLFSQVINLTRPRWQDIPQRKGITVEIETELPKDVPPLTATESEIRESLTNLIFNAVDAMPQGGKITLKAENKEPYIILEVKDTGKGMTDEQKERSLEPFFTTKGEKGTGLGLSAVYGVMQRHKGEMEIESEQGKGTTVRLLFPPGKVQIEKVTADEDYPDLPVLHILCIDDDQTVRESLKEILEIDGHRVEVSECGKDGIEVFNVEKGKGRGFDVVVTDLGMPEMDGWEVAEEIKRLAPDTPVILLSGWGNLMGNGVENHENVTEVLGKPPKIDDLRQALRRVLSKQGNRRKEK